MRELLTVFAFLAVMFLVAWFLIGIIFNEIDKRDDE